MFIKQFASKYVLKLTTKKKIYCSKTIFLLFKLKKQPKGYVLKFKYFAFSTTNAGKLPIYSPNEVRK